MTGISRGGAPRPRILCVDDESALLQGLQRTLRTRFDVTVAISGAAGLEAIEREGPFEVVVSDMRMPGMDGASFLKAVRERAPLTVRILLTGYTDVQAAIAAVNEGRIFRFLSKPCSPDEFRATLDEAVAEHRRERERSEAQARMAGAFTEADKLQDQFLSSVSHELKTPLTVMAMSTELLKNGIAGALTPEQQDLVDGFDHQTSELAGIIESILYALDLSANHPELDMVESPLRDVLDALDACWNGLTPREGVEIRRVLPAERGGTISTDRTKLALVARNLISNAVKFTQKGTITLAVRAERGSLVVEVADTGPGIAPEVLPVIFDRFRQGDGSMTRSHGGLGLGLFVARRVAELLGGTLTVESVVGKGSTFRFMHPGYTPAPSKAESQNRGTA